MVYKLLLTDALSYYSGTAEGLLLIIPMCLIIENPRLGLFIRFLNIRHSYGLPLFRRHSNRACIAHHSSDQISGAQALIIEPLL